MKKGNLFSTFAGLVVLLSLSSCESQNTMLENKSHSFTNDLANESSPYLLQHAHNPVNWKVWNEKTLELARTLDKPLLISIGYSSCHWCHVMERESFEDEEIAAIMNEHFVCIKVDREERPDVDQYYMNAVQLITGSGGWPLNCFAFPNTKPIHGGTYFRKNDWKRLLLRVSDEFKNNRRALEEFSSKLEEGIVNSNSLSSMDLEPDQDWKQYFQEIGDVWFSKLDLQSGGNSGAPKFPLPNNLSYLMRRAFETNDTRLMSFVDLSLEKMCRGGIYDQIGGGFARYSVDAIWKIPHFEKMLYDNAQLMGLYAEAYKRTRSPEYLNILRSTFNWMEREMKDESGLYYSALDADSEGEEGKFYVWKLNQVEEILGDDFGLAKDYYQLNNIGFWEHDNFILVRDGSDEVIRKKYSLTESQFENKVDQIKRRLMNVRSKRIRPSLDNKCLTSWNAMAITALLNCYEATGDELFKSRALRNLKFILESFSIENIKHSWSKEEWKIDAFIEDYAFLIEALIKAYEVSFDSEYLTKAFKFNEHVELHFMDTEQGMYTITAKGNDQLSIKGVEYYDNVIPSSNSVMFRNLIWLSRFSDDLKIEQRLEDFVSKISPRVKHYPSGYSNWLAGLADMYGSARELVIVGEDAERLRKDVAKIYTPGLMKAGSEKDSDLELIKGRYQNKQTLIYMCENRACQRPVQTVEEFLQLYAQD